MINTGFSADQAIEKNNILCRKSLSSFEVNGLPAVETYEACTELSFVKVKGYTSFWVGKEHHLDFTSLMGDIVNGLAKHGISFVYALIGDEKGISLYLGINKAMIDTLISSLNATYYGIDLEPGHDARIFNNGSIHGGCITGYPTNKMDKDEKSLQTENICKGMLGKKWIYIVLAQGCSTILANLAHDKLLTEMAAVNDVMQITVNGGALGNQSYQAVDFNCQNYLENIKLIEKTVSDACSRGMWRVCGYYASDSIEGTNRLSAIIKAAFSGEDSKPEAFRCLPCDNIGYAINNLYMMSDVEARSMSHPIGIWQVPGFNRQIELFKYKYQTIMNSDQLSTLCQLPTKEYPGLYIDDYVEFDNSDRISRNEMNNLKIGDIMFSGRSTNKIIENTYRIDINDLTRHALIIGITGGGKSNTSKAILTELWVNHRKPFLVIESAKREYWELMNLDGFEDLLVFTLGSEVRGQSVKYRINPFEVIGDVSLQTHIDYLLSTFKASFELYAPMPYILETAVYEVYSDRGWDIVENKNNFGLSEYPTLTDLYNKIDIVTDRLGYHAEIQSNVKAALKARINSLRIGGKGAMMDTAKSVPIETILTKPTVLELEDLGDDDIKSFVIGILLVQLYEYRKSGLKGGSKELEHVLLVEEAHRLLKNVPQGGDGTKAKSVEFFCNLLAEIRSFGQGILIADQVPTKLAPDTLKNTNLKIVHRTVMKEDREAIGMAMNMTPDQMEYLSSLRRGFAAVYAEGDNRPKLVKMPLITNKYKDDRKTVINRVNNTLSSLVGSYAKRYEEHTGCAFCQKRCAYKEKINAYSERLNAEKFRKDHLPILAKHKYRPGSVNSFIKYVTGANGKADIGEEICILGKALSFSDLDDSHRMQTIVDYIQYHYAGRNNNGRNR